MLLDTCVKASTYPHEAIKLAHKCKGEVMGKVKGTVSSVSDDIKPYVTKKGFKKYIGDAALSDVSRILLTKYSNVKLSVYVDDDGCSHLKVEVKKLFGGGVLDFLLTQRRKANRENYSLEWIYRIEEFDALL